MGKSFFYMRKAIWEVVALRIGAVATFSLGTITGGMFMSKTFILQKGDFVFSTRNDDHALQLMQETYSGRVHHLVEMSKQQLEKLEAQDTTPDAKRKIVESVIDFYLTPTYHDKLFSRDIVIFNGKGKPIIILRNEFDRIKDNWSRVLSNANVKKCVDNYLEDFSPYNNKQRHTKICNECLKTFEDYYLASLKIPKIIKVDS